MVYDSAAESGMREILSADRNFDVGRFVEGAQAAYGMILEAFWKGDKEELKSLCDDDVYESFAEVIDAREKRGEILENQVGPDRQRAHLGSGLSPARGPDHSAI